MNTEYMAVLAALYVVIKPQTLNYLTDVSSCAREYWRWSEKDIFIMRVASV